MSTASSAEVTDLHVAEDDTRDLGETVEEITMQKNNEVPADISYAEPMMEGLLSSVETEETRLRSKVFSLNRLWTLSFGISSPSLRNWVNSGGWDWVDGLESVPYPMESQQIKSYPRTEPRTL